MVESIAGDVILDLDEEDALMLLFRKKARIYYTGIPFNYQPEDGGTYAVDANEDFWEIGDEQRLDFIREQLRDAVTIFAVRTGGKL